MPYFSHHVCRHNLTYKQTYVNLYRDDNIAQTVLNQLVWVLAELLTMILVLTFDLENPVDWFRMITITNRTVR